MMIQIQLTRNGWVTKGQEDVVVYVRGRAHYGKEYFGTTKLVDEFLSRPITALNEFVAKLNGNWAVVVKHGESVFLAVDHLRSYQLLYYKTADETVVFDDLRAFREGRELNLDERSLHEMLSDGFIWRNRTMFKDIFSLQSGECVTLDPSGNELTSRSWRWYPTNDRRIKPGDDLVKRIDNSFLNAFKRTVESLDGRRVMIPLSGGMDSRLVASYFSRLGYKNVVCYSYGPKEGVGTVNSLDAKYSKQVADALGYQWHYVPMSLDNWWELYCSDELSEYNRWFSNGTTFSFQQDIYALRELKSWGVLQPGDVVVPGHSFNIAAGEEIRKACRFWNVASELTGGMVSGFITGSYWRTIKDLRSLIATFDVKARRYAREVFVWENELCKFIFNTGRTYEWFDCEWRFPLADKEPLDLWLQIPYRLRYDRAYYTEIHPLLCVSALRDIPLTGFGHREQLSTWGKCKYDFRAWIPSFFIALSRGFRYNPAGTRHKELWEKPYVLDLRQRLIERLPFASLKERLEKNPIGTVLNLLTLRSIDDQI